MRRVCLLAFVTLKVLHDELDEHVLLEDGATEHFPRNGQADLESPGMRLRPDEAGVEHFHSL